MSTLDPTLLYFDDAKIKLGIQEKYLLRQLTAHEALSMLDMQRFIRATQMQDQVLVAEIKDESTLVPAFNAFSKKLNSKTTTSQALLLDASAFLELHPCWLSLILTLDPIAHKITYQLNLDQKLLPEQIKKIDTWIRQHIRQHLSEQLTIASQVTNQPTTFNGSYHVLHELYQDPVCKGYGNQRAKQFSEIAPTDMFGLKQAIYKAQLESLSVSPEIFGRFPQMQQNFDHGRIKPAALAQQIQFLRSPAKSSTQHFLVNKRVGELRLYEKNLRFPGEKPLEAVKAEDYTAFLLLTHQRLVEANQARNYFDDLVLECFDAEAALQGLIAYAELNLPLPFKTLTFDLFGLNNASNPELDQFIFHFKTVLTLLSKSQIESIQFIHAGCLTEQHMAELLSFIRDRQEINLDLTLAEPYQTSATQQQLDQVLSDRIQMRKITQLQQQGIDLRPKEKSKRIIRQRPRLKNVAISIDVQQEQEQQKQIAIESASELSLEPTGEPAPTEFYNLNRFIQAWQNGSFSDHANSHWLDSSKAFATKVWCQWVGAFNPLDANQSGMLISKTACEELLRYYDAFQDGLDLKLLPPGFSLKHTAQDSRIDFNPRLKAIAKREPLAVQTYDFPADLPLSHIQVELLLKSPAPSILRALWQKLNTLPYDKPLHRYFRQNLPRLLQLEPSRLQLLLTLASNPDDSVNQEKLQFLLDSGAAKLRIKASPKKDDANLKKRLQRMFRGQAHAAQLFLLDYQEVILPLPQHALAKLLSASELQQVEDLLKKYPFLQLNGLLQLYIQFGSQGLTRFTEQLTQHSDTLQQLFHQQAHYALCMQKDFTDALQTIKGFELNANESRWWCKLLKQHCHAQYQVNLVALVNAFIGFKAQLTKLLPEAFPNKAAFKTVTSLPATLSRSIALLKHCASHNRKPQLAELSSLDSSSTGFMKAISTPSTKQWAFITKEMNINAYREAHANPNVTTYTAPNNWKKIAAINAYSGFNVHLLSPDESDEDLILARYPGSFVFKNYTSDSAYKPEIIENIKTNCYAREALHPGETDAEYMARVRELMNHQPSKFFTLDELKKLGFKPSGQGKYYIGGEEVGREGWYKGSNIHFLNKLPAPNDTNYRHSYLYVNQKLYYVHADLQLEEIKINAAKFEKKCAEEMNAQRAAAKRDFLKRKIEAYDRRKYGHWHYYPFSIELQIVDSYEQAQAITKNKTYVYVGATNQLYQMINQQLVEIDLQEVDPKNILAEFNKPVTSWFFSTDTIRWKLLNNKFWLRDQYDLDRTIENFFRYASYQQQQSEVPLDIFQHAHQKLTDQTHFSTTLKCVMYQVLGGVLYDVHDYLAEDIKKYLDEIIEFNVPVYTEINFFLLGIPALDGYTADDLRIELIEIISRLNPLPPLPFFKKLMTLFSTNLNKIIHAALIIEKLQNSKPGIYKGMRDYTDAEFIKDKANFNTSSNLLLRHVQTIEAIRAFNDYFKNLKTNIPNLEPCIDYLHELISTFQLQMRCDIQQFNLPGIVNVQYEMDRKSSFQDPLFQQLLPLFIFAPRRFERLLMFLSQMDCKKAGQTTRLTQQDFIDILKAVFTGQPDRNESDAQVNHVYTILKTFKFKNGKYLYEYYPNHLIPEPSIDYTIPPEVKQKLQETFSHSEQRKNIETLLLQFRDSHHYEPVVDLLTAICQRLSAQQQDNFVRKLCASKGLFLPATSLDPQHSAFVKLLRDIKNNKQHDLFVYFVEAERKLQQKTTPKQQQSFFTTDQNQLYIPHLASRMQVYMHKINPALEEMRPRAIPQVELIPRVLETLLKTPVDELNREGCCLLASAYIPSLKDLASYSLPKPAAYLVVNNEVYYVNQPLQICKKLTLTLEQQQQFTASFQQKLENGSIVTPTIVQLTDTQLAQLAQLTNHIHQDYSHELVHLYRQINQLVADNPGVKKQFLELFDRLLDDYDPQNAPQLLPYLTTFIQQLHRSFTALTNKNLVISLCLLFKTEEGELTPAGLLKLLTMIQDNAADATDQAFFMHIVVALISNQRDYSLTQFTKICTLANTNAEFKALLRDQFYNHAPYPTLQQILEWHTNATKQTTLSYQAHIATAYDKFDKTPVPRQTRNGFNEKKAVRQLALFKYDYGAYDKKNIIPKTFYALTMAMRKKTTAELRTLLQQFNPDNPTYDAQIAKDMETLLAIAAELLYRSKGMEINTTQYLAILSMLKSPGHVTNQVATGEGKSRIMMINCVCQFAQGKTVDFVTSDIHLATRDFVEYQAYFNLVGAPSRLIFADSHPSVYQKRGINFSDPTHLILLRNKARSMGQADLIIDEPKRRALLLDEADRTYFDVANSRFNFSSTGDELIRDMPWVYSLLMAYFSQPTIQVNGKAISPLELYHDDIELCRETFMQFAYKSPLCDEQNKLRLQTLSYEKIEEWQSMAFIAKQQLFKEHFDIRPNQLIQTENGLKMSSEAVLIIANELAESSKLSFGAHQCLNAHLDNLRQNPDLNADPHLKKALAECEYEFHIPDEKQIIYSSTSKNLLDDYHEGTLNAVTGTAGAIRERVEGRLLYRAQMATSAPEPMHFIDVPRELGLRRQDKAFLLRANKTKQQAAIIEKIKIARSKNQPILIIAENPKESAELFQVIQKAIKTKDIQHVYPKQSLKARNAAIDKAGLPGQITISTGMLGRGTDIILQGKAKQHGLLVMTTFLPRLRDMFQYAGRSGRYGDVGEYLAVLDKSRLKKTLGKKTLSDGFYTHTEDYIKREQAKMDRRAQLQRLVEHTVGDFRKQLTDSFFIDLLKPLQDVKVSDILPIWSKFFAQSDQAWNMIQPKIQVLLATDKPQPQEIDKFLNEYRDKTQGHWNQLRQEIANLKLRYVNPETDESSLAVKLLSEELPPLALSQDIKRLMLTVEPNKQSLRKIKFYDHYDIAHDGRAVKYTRWYIPLVASLKGWANLLPGVNFQAARKPFANFRAWFAGHGQLFADFRASQNKGVIVTTGVLGLLAAAGGATLLLLNLWLAPLFCYAMIAAGGAMVLGVTSGTVGRIADDLTDIMRHNDEQFERTVWQNMVKDTEKVINPEKPARASRLFAPAPRSTASAHLAAKSQTAHRPRH